MLQVPCLKKTAEQLFLAESCTGGLISKKLTDRSGSSAYFWGSFVTYDNSAKNLLGVKKETLENYGAVSAETVSEMAECAAEKSGADISVSCVRYCRSRRRNRSKTGRNCMVRIQMCRKSGAD